MKKRKVPSSLVSEPKRTTTQKPRLPLPFHGEGTCCECERTAYYEKDNRAVCGYHGKKPRKPLARNPNARAVKESEHAERERKVEEAAALNRKTGTWGKLTLQKMNMMKNPTNTDGVRLVFPNFKHQHRKDGFGCASLSPKAMGPIQHNQPGLPMAQNLENMHQGNKVFPLEYENNNKTIKPDFYQTRLDMYKDSNPHRHKQSSGKKNKPLFSVWVNPDGTERRLTYVESRQIYCYFYEEFALKDPHFHALKTMLCNGYNLEIVGYDAFQPDKVLSVHYLDESRPFGHELVLYSLLLGERPWDDFTFLFQPKDLQEWNDDTDEQQMERSTDEKQWVETGVHFGQCDYKDACPLYPKPQLKLFRFLKTKIVLCSTCFSTVSNREDIVSYYTF